MNSFTPRITVATIIEHQQRFLMVREDKHLGELLYNQPAGHVEANEKLVVAAAREVLEETAWEVDISAFVGHYIFQSAVHGPVYFRYCFAGTARSEEHTSELQSRFELVCRLLLEKNKQK